MAEKNQNYLTNLGVDIVKELNLVVQKVLVDNKVKSNSDLVDSVEWEFSRSELLMYVNDYYSALSKGRKPLAKKIPIFVLVNWIKKYQITSPKYSTNRLAFIIQNSIYKNGITGKNFIEQVEKSVSDIVEIRLADNLDKFISDSLFVAFKVK
jgi:hypothetical protein